MISEVRTMQERVLRILAADDDESIQTYYRRLMPTLGHELVGVAASGKALVADCRALKPDLIITDIKMPDMDGIEAARQIYEQQPVPIILISGYHDRDLIERAAAEHILGYLVKPVRQESLQAEIGVAMRRFEEFQILRMEAQHYRQTLQDRKVIEQAKGILMKKAGLDEQSAFRRLQTIAAEKNQKLAEIAKMIVLADVAFGA